MDFYGKQNFLKYITNFLLNTKEFRKSEYIDFYNYGFEKEVYIMQVFMRFQITKTINYT